MNQSTIEQIKQTLKELDMDDVDPEDLYHLINRVIDDPSYDRPKLNE